MTDGGQGEVGDALDLGGSAPLSTAIDDEIGHDRTRLPLEVGHRGNRLGRTGCYPAVLDEQRPIGVRAVRPAQQS